MRAPGLRIGNSSSGNVVALIDPVRIGNSSSSIGFGIGIGADIFPRIDGCWPDLGRREPDLGLDLNRLTLIASSLGVCSSSAGSNIVRPARGRGGSEGCRANEADMEGRRTPHGHGATYGTRAPNVVDLQGFFCPAAAPGFWAKQTQCLFSSFRRCRVSSPTWPAKAAFGSRGRAALPLSSVENLFGPAYRRPNGHAKPTKK
jgi:hypothetical protein